MRTRVGKVAGPPLYHKGRLYPPGYAFNCFDAKTGKKIWKRGVSTGGLGIPLPAFYQDMLVMNGRYAYGIRLSDGKDVWKYDYGKDRTDTEKNVRQSPGGLSSPLIVGDIAYMGSETGCLYAFQARTGKLLWKQKIGVPVKSSPCASGNALFVADYDGNLWAFAAR